jgi:hypothetical protein
MVILAVIASAMADSSDQKDKNTAGSRVQDSGQSAAARAAAIPEATASQSGQPAPSRGGIFRDPQTGLLSMIGPDNSIIPLSPELQNALSTSHEGLVEEQAPGGGVIVNLQGRFQSLMVATQGTDNKVSVECLSNSVGETHSCAADKLKSNNDGKE